MLELTGLGSLLRGVGLLYWLLAIGCIFLTLKIPKGVRLKALCASGVLLAFGYLPVTAWIEQSRREAFAREAWAYFKKKCETEAGEKIYKTFTGVKSVLVVKPLPPATEKDLFDQYWMGDPYSASAHSNRGQVAASTFLGPSPLKSSSMPGFEFVEIVGGPNSKASVMRIATKVTDRLEVEETSVDIPVSRFTLAWEDISTETDRSFWVAGSKLVVFDSLEKKIVAQRIGFILESGFGSKSGQRRPWLSSRGPTTTCPSLTNGAFDDRLFVMRALKTPEDDGRGK